MTGALDRIADGRWLTAQRARRLALVSFAITTASLLSLLITASGTLDWMGRPIGTDFSNVYAAGRMALDGHAAAVWDWPQHYAAQQALHGRADVPFYGWHYPPPFLMVAALLALMPYLVALVAWQGVTAALALAVVLRVAPGRWTLPIALGFPAAFVCLGHGQNGFLTAALLGGAMLALDRQPNLAGVLIGLIAYKPQFGFLLPLLLIAGGQWRVAWVATLTVLTLYAVPIVVLGPDVWPAFATSIGLTRDVVIGEAQTGPAKMITPYAAILLNGGSAGLAWSVQSTAIVLAAALVVMAARAPAPLRGAVVIPAVLIATPYAFDYDMVALGMAIAFLAEQARRYGWRRYERSALALAYAAPLIGRQFAEVSGVPLNLIAIVAVLLIATRRLMTAGSVAPRLTASPYRHSRAGFAR